ERGTALYDSVVFALYYFNGLRGQRELIALSRGQDETSKFKLDDVLDFARRAGVTIYTIGLALDRGEHEAKKALEKMAADTGGRRVLVAQGHEHRARHSEIPQGL